MIRVWLSLFILLSINSRGQMDAADFNLQADQLIREYYTAGRFSGEVLMAKDREVLYHRCLLLPGPENQEETGDHALFCLASVSKIFTGSSILLLEKRGKLSIDQSIRAYFPELSHNYEAVRIRHLLTHTSGIPEKRGSWQERLGESNQDILDFLIRNEELEFEPGTAYQYSNNAFILLAMLVEVVSGKRYGDFLQDEIFSEAGMEHSFVPDSMVEAERYLELEKHGVMHSYNKGVRADWPLYTYGAGGIYSTAMDMLKWDTYFFSCNLFDKIYLERIFTPVTVNGKEQHYGLGWGIYKSEGEILLGHSGSMFGFRSLYEHQKQSGICIVILGNMGDEMPVMEIRTRILNLFQESEYK